jgi:hypothetical protein
MRKILTFVLILTMMISFTSANGLGTGHTLIYINKTTNEEVEALILQKLSIAGIDLFYTKTTMPTYLEFDYHYKIDVDKNNVKSVEVDISGSDLKYDVVLTGEGLPLTIIGSVNLAIFAEIELINPSTKYSDTLNLTGTIAPFLNDIGNLVNAFSGEQLSIISTGYNFTSTDYYVNLSYIMNIDNNEDTGVVRVDNPELMAKARSSSKLLQQAYLNSSYYYIKANFPTPIGTVEFSGQLETNNHLKLHEDEEDQVLGEGEILSYTITDEFEEIGEFITQLEFKSLSSGQTTLTLELKDIVPPTSPGSPASLTWLFVFAIPALVLIRKK